jgi:hypothetical protein
MKASQPIALGGHCTQSVLVPWLCLGIRDISILYAIWRAARRLQ